MFSIKVLCRNTRPSNTVYLCTTLVSDGGMWRPCLVVSLQPRFGVVMVCVFAARLIEFCVPNLCCFSAAKARFYFCVLLRTSLAHSLVLVVVVAVVVDFLGLRPLNEMGGVVGAAAGPPHFQVEWASWVSSRGCPHQLEVVKELSDGMVYPKLF